MPSPHLSTMDMSWPNNQGKAMYDKDLDGETWRVIPRTSSPAARVLSTLLVGCMSWTEPIGDG